MGFFDGVKDCNAAHDGGHPWGEVKPGLFGDFAQTCDGCGVTAWGKTPQDAMQTAQDTDRANRAGRLW